MRGLDSSLAEPSLGQLGPHGSWGFSPVGGNRLYSEGEPVNVLSRKGKEDCRNSWWYLRSTWKRTTCSTFAWFLATRSGECRFSSGKICARAYGPQNGILLGGGRTRRFGASSPQESLPPLPRGWVAGAKRPRGGTTCGRRGEVSEQKTKKKSRNQTGRKAFPHQNSLFQFGIPAVPGIKLFLIKFIPVASFASHLHVRVRVFNPNPNPNSHGDCCHCLLDLWLVESFNWYASHCFKALSAVFSEF